MRSLSIIDNLLFLRFEAGRQCMSVFQIDGRRKGMLSIMLTLAFSSAMLQVPRKAKMLWTLISRQIAEGFLIYIVVISIGKWSWLILRTLSDVGAFLIIYLMRFRSALIIISCLKSRWWLLSLPEKRNWMFVSCGNVNRYTQNQWRIDHTNR